LPAVASWDETQLITLDEVYEEFVYDDSEKKKKKKKDDS
jgi:hypothetical protein